MCSFLPVFLYLFLRSPRFSSIWPAFTLTVHINALYNESAHGREEHARRINTIPLKIETLLNLQYSDRCAHCIRYESPLFGSEAPGRAKRFSVASMGSRRHDSHPSLLRPHKRNKPGYSTHICIPVIQSNYFLFTTFIYAKLGMLPPTRCLRCATDGSA